jgi:EXLDI family protein
MPNKTIYVSKEDTSLFEEAKQIAGEALSSVIAKALREFVANSHFKRKGMREVKLKVGTYGSEREVRFAGSWMGDWKGFSDDKEWFLRAVIYHTQKENWAVYLETVCKASLLTDKKSWKESGEFLLQSKRTDLIVGKTFDDLKDKLPKKLFEYVQELSEREKNPIEYMDI